MAPILQVGWVCTNSVNLEATFREGSVLLQNDSLTKIDPSLEKCLPVGDGVKNYVQFVSGILYEKSKFGVFKSVQMF